MMSCLRLSLKAGILPRASGGRFSMKRFARPMAARVDLFLPRNRSRQNPANGGATDLQAAGDLGFADAGTIQLSRLVRMEPGGYGSAQCHRSVGRGPDWRPVLAEFLFRTPRILPVVRPWPGPLASSDPGLRSGRRSRRRDAATPGA